MNKIIYQLLILSLLFASCTNNTSVKRFIYTDSIYTPRYAQLPEVDKALPYNATEIYTRKGMLKKLIYRGSGSDINFEKRNKIEDGRITQSKHIRHWKNDTIYEIFFYNNNKQTAYAKANSRGLFLYTENITYNNNRIDTVKKVEYNVPAGSEKYFYDSIGRLSGINESSFMGEIETAKRYYYHPNDSIAKLKIYKWGFISQITYFEYDSLDRLTYKLDSNYTNKLRTQVFLSYDTHNLVTSKKFVQNKGDKSKEINIEIKRDYNEHGDWVSRTEFVNGDTARVLNRAITYWRF